MSARGLAEHLQHPVGRGRAPDGASSGAAGGAACGDLVRLSVRVGGGRVAAASFDASGCGATIAAGSAAVSLVEGAGVLAAARVGAREIAAELGGLSPGKLHAAELASDALHRALGAAARASAVLTCAPNRTLVALSGGVDSAVAALLVARAGREPVAVTLELWADPGTHDAEASCCSAHAVRLARGVAHGMGLPHITLDLRSEFRAGVVDPFLAEHAAGLDPEPVRALQRPRAPGRHAGPRRAPRRVRAGDRPLRAPQRRRAAACGGRSREGPDVHARRARPGIARAPALSARRADQAAGAGAGARGGPAGRRPPRVAGSLLPRGTGKRAFLARHGALGERPGAIVDRSGRRLGAHPGQHLFTIGQRRGLGVAAGEPLYVLAKDARANTVTVGPAAALATRRVALRAAVLHRPGEVVDRVKLRYRSAPVGGRLAGAPAAGRHAQLELVLDEPVAGAAPGQAACLLADDVVVGWGWISA